MAHNPYNLYSIMVRCPKQLQCLHGNYLKLAYKSNDSKYSRTVV